MSHSSLNYWENIALYLIIWFPIVLSYTALVRAEAVKGHERRVRIYIYSRYLNQSNILPKKSLKG